MQLFRIKTNHCISSGIEKYFRPSAFGYNNYGPIASSNYESGPVASPNYHYGSTTSPNHDPRPFDPKYYYQSETIPNHDPGLLAYIKHEPRPIASPKPCSHATGL